MIEVARANGVPVFLGDHTHTRNISLRQQHGIKAVMVPMHDPLDIPVNGAEVLRVSAPDGPGWKPEHTRQSVEFLEDVHLRRGLPTLCACWTGKSRSVSVLTAYLWKHRDELRIPLEPLWDPSQLAEWMRNLRGHGATLPEPAVWLATLAYLGIPTECF